MPPELVAKPAVVTALRTRIRGFRRHRGREAVERANP